MTIVATTLRFNRFNVQLLFQFAIKEYTQISIAYYVGHIFRHFPAAVTWPFIFPTFHVS